MAETTEAKYSLTVKVAGDLLTVRGDTHDEFNRNIDNLLLSPATLGKVFDVQDQIRQANVPSQVQAAEAVLQQAGVVPAPAEPAADQWAQPAAAAAPSVSSGGPVEIETDRWGKRFTYNAPGAPTCPNGTMLLLEAVSKAGKQYRAWVDPLEGPRPCKKVTEKVERQFL